MAYLARLRAEHAATLLLHSDQPVTYRARFATGAIHGSDFRPWLAFGAQPKIWRTEMVAYAIDPAETLCQRRRCGPAQRRSGP